MGGHRPAMEFQKAVQKKQTKQPYSRWARMGGQAACQPCLPAPTLSLSKTSSRALMALSTDSSSCRSRIGFWW